jgi:hypothetical protein
VFGFDFDLAVVREAPRHGICYLTRSQLGRAVLDHGVRCTRSVARRRSLSNASDALVSVTSGPLGAEVCSIPGSATGVVTFDKRRCRPRIRSVLACTLWSHVPYLRRAAGLGIGANA